jgi:hypothetical protein
METELIAQASTTKATACLMLVYSDTAKTLADKKSQTLAELRELRSKADCGNEASLLHAAVYKQTRTILHAKA